MATDRSLRRGKMLRRNQVCLLALLSSLALAGCEVPGECVAPKETTTLTAFETQGKVLVTQSFSKQLNTQSLSMDGYLPQGTELTVVVDHSCQASTNARLTISDEFPQERGVRSHRWKLSKTIKLDDLKREALDDSCIVGISRPIKLQKF